MYHFVELSRELFLLCLLINHQGALSYDQCKDLCKNAKLPLTIPNEHQGVRVVCHRGCRFFNIIKYNFRLLSVKKIKDKCYYNACASAYKLKEEAIVCKKGCELMATKTKQSLLFGLPQENNSADNIFSQPDIVKLESSMLSNPIVKQELEEGINIDQDYTISEKHNIIRTMPILIPGSDEIVDPEDWLTYASKNSGIPKWILCTVMSTAVLAAVCVNLSQIVGDRTDEDFDLEEILIDMAYESVCLAPVI